MSTSVTVEEEEEMSTTVPEIKLTMFGFHSSSPSVFSDLLVVSLDALSSSISMEGKFSLVN